MITQKRLKEVLSYDPDDGIFISNKTWDEVGSNDGRYLKIGIDYKRYHAHRLAWLYMTGEWPEQIDHINGDRADNRFSNLRNVNPQENQKNMKRAKNNKSGQTGVCLNKKNGNWLAYINSNGKRISLGQYEDKEKAISVRKTAELLYNFHPNHGRL